MTSVTINAHTTSNRSHSMCKAPIRMTSRKCGHDSDLNHRCHRDAMLLQIDEQQTEEFYEHEYEQDIAYH